MSEEVAAINESSNHTNTSETKIEAEKEAVNIGIFTGTGSGGTSSSESELEKGKETTGKKTGNGIPKDQVALKLILASGKSSEFLFQPFASVGKVTECVYKNWPDEWADEKESITSHHVLRLIYQGRFLHENVTFTALKLPPGKRTVMHLVPREKLPQLSPDDLEKNPKTSERSCCCNVL